MSSESHSLVYRRDIDGLRGIAVGAVVLFHAEVPGFSGGFVGVDIFFVISGFLITSIIAGEVSKNRFSFLQFYDRRIRRIFPALFAVYLFCLATGLILSMPPNLKSFGESLMNSSIFFSNHHFFNHSGYFADASYLKPLLHTWSLSVEEQFYLIWPFSIVLLWRCRSASARLGILLAVALLSLAYAEWEIARENPRAAFYLLPGRGWELIVGAVLALALPQLAVPRGLADAFMLAGLALIAGSVTLLSPDSNFPGLNAVFPCIGASMLILAGHGNTPRTSLLYTNPVTVGIGLISYSLYLWHWPLFSYCRIAMDRPLTTLDAALLIVASIVIATFSYRYIELPFRQRRSAFAQRTIQIGVMTIAVFAVAGFTMSWLDGIPQRFNAAANEIFTLTASKRPSNGCAEARLLRNSHCLLGLRSTEGKYPEVVLTGDSHALHYAPAIDDALKGAGLSGQLLAKGGCPPLIGVVTRRAGREHDECAKMREQLAKLLAQNKDLKLIIIAARWERYSEDTWAEAAEPRPAIRLVDDIDTRPGGKETSRRVLERTLRRMIGDFIGSSKRVVLLGQIPPFPDMPSTCIARARIYHRSEEHCYIAASLSHMRTDYANALLKRLASEFHGVEAFIPSEVTCDDTVCSPFLNGVFLYRDSNHMNATGARQFAPYIARLSAIATYPRGEDTPRLSTYRPGFSEPQTTSGALAAPRSNMDATMR